MHKVASFLWRHARKILYTKKGRVKPYLPSRLLKNAL
jgi:hypothetical protein